MAEEGEGGLSDGVVVISTLGSGCQSKRRGGLCTGLPLMSYDGLQYGIDTGTRKGNGTWEMESSRATGTNRYHTFVWR